MSTSLLSVRHVDFSYTPDVPTLSDINLELVVGRNLGIVGGSGSGKSTILKLLLGIIAPDSGEILFKADSLNLDDKEQARAFRQSLQVVFQDPYSSLDPRQRIDKLIGEPLQSLSLAPDKKKAKKWIEEEVVQALEAVGLTSDLLRRYPREFSGGQRQRIAIARAIVCKPTILLADEPVSALDVTTRVLVIELLQELHEKLNLSIAMVSHDLSLIAALCQDAIVLEGGKIVEDGTTAEVLGNPQHEYTQKLLRALPRLPIF